MATNTLRLFLPELILLFGAAVVFVLDLVQRHRARDRVLVGISVASLLAAALAAYSLRGRPESPLFSTMAVDGFAVFLKVIVLLGVAVVLLLSVDYMRQRSGNRGEFYTFLLCAALAISVATSANDLLMVYLAMEFLSITSYILAGFLRQDVKSNEAGLKYFVYGAVASGVMLYGISLIFGITGSTNLVAVAQALSSQATAAGMRWLSFTAVVLLAVGFGFKASLVPFHQWVPDTYEGAPTPITAFLATASKAAGFALLVRTMLVALPQFSLDWLTVLAGLSIVTMTLGNLVALRQSDIKRLLAYSSVAHAGYILIGLVSVPQTNLTLLPLTNNTFNGVNGVLFYLFGYLFTNLGAFAVVIAVENQTGSTAIKDYAGLIRRSPWLAALLLIFLLSLAGIPPTLGFWGKYFVFGAAIQVQFYTLALVGLINAVIAAGYYLNIVRYMFFVPAEAEEPILVAPALNVALWVSLAVVLLAGILPSAFINWAGESVQFLTRL